MATFEKPCERILKFYYSLNDRIMEEYNNITEKEKFELGLSNSYLENCNFGFIRLSGGGMILKHPIFQTESNII